MKRLLFFGVVASVTSLALLSCTKNAHDSRGPRSVTIDTTIASGSTYALDLKQYGDADDVATIKTQATNYTTSEIINAGTGFAPVYHFSAASAKTAATEQVVIAVTEGNHGQRHANCDSTLVTINFTIQ